MASNSSAPDPKVVNSIVDRLKKQGLFDKFRKECLADVDTKPAYLNLRHRTEVAVARFLSTQTWHPDMNKNQLRNSLRKHINESSMMSSGIDRVVEQVVNPKIHRVFKPQIDRVVCEFLGIDPDERERQLKLRDEEQRRQRMQMECSYLPGGQQQLFPPGTMTPDGSYGVGSSPTIPSLLDFRVPYMSRGNDHIDSPSAGSVTPQMNAASGSSVGGSTSLGAMTFSPPMPYGFPAGMQYGYPTQTGMFPGMTQQGMLTQQYPLGYTPNPAIIPPGFVTTIPQYPMQTVATDVTVAPPQVAQPLVAPIEASPVVATETKEKDRKQTKKKKPEPLTVEELLNIPLPPKTHIPTKGKDTQRVGKKEEAGIQSPIVMETKDDVKPAAKREMSMKQVEETKLTAVTVAPLVEKIKVESQDSVSSKDVVEVEKSKSRHPEKADRSKVKAEKVQEKAKSKDVQKTIREPSRQMDTNKALDIAKKSVNIGTVVSDTSNIKLEMVKVELEENGKNKKVSDQALDDSTTTTEDEGDGEKMEGDREKMEGDGESKVYHFVWDNVDAGCISDATVSSVHTSDLSSFDDGSDMTTRSSDEEIKSKVTNLKVEETVELETDGMISKETGAEAPAEVATVAAPRQKPRRLISLQYNYSDSEEEESREERKARVAREIEERYLRRQQRRAELEAKRKEREDEKAVEREERRRRKRDEAASATAEKEEAAKEAKDEEKEATEDRKDKGSGEAKTKRTKEKRKEELREQKVMEKKMALRRQRTRNRRYTSDEFTTFFSDNKRMRSNESYTKVTGETYSSHRSIDDVTSPPTPTQDEHFAYAGSHPSEGASHTPPADHLSIPIYEVTTTLTAGLSMSKFVHMTRSKTKQLTLDTGDGALEPGMPYSDVSSDALSFSGSSVDSKLHHSPSEGKHDQTSPHAMASSVKGHEKPAGRDDGDTSLSRVRRKSSGDTDSRQKQCQSSDASSTTSSVESTKPNVQRYAVSDLYKPHHSRSRSSRHSSPPPPQREPQVRPSSSDPDKGQEKRRAPPIHEVDFGEAAKKSLQQISFGEAERRSKIRQRFGPPTRHEARRGSSSKSPGDRVERTPAREPTTPSGSYWSARDEKYRDTLKSSSTHGSWQSTKSSSQEDDDDTSRSKGRSRSMSQSDWRTEESPATSERKTKRRERRRKMEDSSCSGSEEYSRMSREKRVSQSSSGGDDLFPASSGCSPRGRQMDDEESCLMTQRREEEAYDSAGSMSDAAEDQYTSELEDVGKLGLYSQEENFDFPTSSAENRTGVKNDEYNVNQAAGQSRSVDRVECEGEVEATTVESPDNGDRTSLQSQPMTETQELEVQDGEIQLEIWQGSSHWSLSVENLGTGTELTPSGEVISVQEPISDIVTVTGDQVEFICDQVEVRSDQVEVRGDQVEVRGDQVEVSLDQVEIRGDKVEVRDDHLEVRCEQVAVRGDQIEGQDDQVDVKDDQIDVKGDQVEVRSDQVEVKGDQVGVKGSHVEVNIDQMEVNTEYQSFYNEPLDEARFSCVDGTSKKGQKRPQSSDSDGGSPLSVSTKRPRSDSPGAANDESVAADPSHGETPSASIPPGENISEHTPLVREQMGFSTAHPVENPPPVEPVVEQQLVGMDEEHNDVLTEMQPSGSTVCLETETPNVQAEVAMETHDDIVDSDSLEMIDIHVRLQDSSTGSHQMPGELDITSYSTAGQTSPSLPKILPVTATSAPMEESPSNSDRTDVRALTPEKRSTNSVSPTFDRSSATAVRMLPTSATTSLSPVGVSPTLEDTSVKVSSISPIPDRKTPLEETSVCSQIVTVATAVDDVMLTSKGEELPRSTGVTTGAVSPSAAEDVTTGPVSPSAAEDVMTGAVSPSAAEDVTTGPVSPSAAEDVTTGAVSPSAAEDITEAQPEADVQVSPSNMCPKAEDKIATEDLRNKDAVDESQSPRQDEAQGVCEVTEVAPHSGCKETEPSPESQDQPALDTTMCETTESGGDDKDTDSEQSDRKDMGKSDEDSDVLNRSPCGELDTLLVSPQPSMQHGSGHESDDSVVATDDSVEASTSKDTLEDHPDSLPGTCVIDAGQSAHVENYLPKNDVDTASSSTETNHPTRDHVEKHLLRDDVEVSPISSDVKYVEGVTSSPRSGISDADSSLDEDVSETKSTETLDKKGESKEEEYVPDTAASTQSVSPGSTPSVEAKSAAPKHEDKDSREVVRRKSRRSVAEQQKDADIHDHDGQKSTALPRQRTRDHSQSLSASTRETRGHRAGATPPDGTSKEPRKLRRPSTPPPTRSRPQSAGSGGAVQQQTRPSSAGRKPGKVVTPPSKVVTPPAAAKVGKGKAGHIPMTRASRRKSEEASLPIAKRLRR